jgi:two-component system, NarL family, nitrate/nitrite response regulator NarL
VGAAQGKGGGAAPDAGRPLIRLWIVSPMRIYREGLAHVLAARDGLALVGCDATYEPAIPVVRRCEVDVVLFDLRCPSGLVGLRRLATAPSVSVIALGLRESVEWVVACAEAGIAGYVTDDTSLEELVSRIEDAAHGDFKCPPHIAASLLRRLGAIGPSLSSPAAGSRLTSRELEVAALLQEGLSNRQIATRLTIQLPTVKNHVHSILEKLETPTRTDAAAVLRRGAFDVPAGPTTGVRA